MRTALAHRGPDASGVAVAGNVGLVHTRLAIVDPSERGAQPMRDSAGRWLLSYNGEVFNHRELRGQLGEERFAGGSDTETVVRSLARWGEEAVPRFNGLFAFAAVDLERNRLLLVRDRFGVKPLYLARAGPELWFASEIGALLAAGVPRRAAREWIAWAIEFGWPPEPHTPIEGIERLPAGSILSLDLATLEYTVRRWYDPLRAVDPERQAELERRSRSELASAVEEELRASVHRRLMADVPIGTMCSGGLDSSLITALAKERRPDIVAFNVSVPGDRLDEGPAASRAAAGLGIELATAELTPSSWRASFVEAVRHFEHPFANASPVGILKASRLARSHGVKALLTGEGADELMGGYRGFHAPAFDAFLKPGSRLRHLVDSVRALGTRRSLQVAVQRARGRDVTLGPRRLLYGDGGPPDFGDAFAHARDAYSHHQGARAQAEAELLIGLSAHLPALLNRMDKNAMQASVETRTPFLDPGVVALMLNLPLEARLTPRVKGVLRDVALSHLPRSTALRPKVYGMAWDSSWITEAADPSFLEAGRLRELLGLPRADWEELLRARGPVPVRLWSAEVWCRTVLAGDAVSEVDRELWPNGPQMQG